MFLDSAVFVIMIVSVFYGIKTGFIVGATSFFGLIFSACIANQYLDVIYLYLIGFLKIDYFPVTVNDNYNIYIFSYVLLMVSVYMLTYLCALFLRKIFGALMLGWLDVLLGAIFGFVKGILFSILFLSIMIFLSKFSGYIGEMIYSSQIIAKLPNLSGMVLDMLPFEVRDYILFYVN